MRILLMRNRCCDMKRNFNYKITAKDAGKTIGAFLLEHEYTPTCIKFLKKAESLITVNGKWKFVNKQLKKMIFWKRFS